MSQKGLTEKQRKFVLYYEGNATEAAIKAGYSKKTAHVTAHHLLKNPKIQSALSAKQAPKEKKHIMSVEERMERLTEIADSEDEKAAIKAMDILNKMEAVYLIKQEVTHNFQGKSDQEVIQVAVEQLEAMGYKVIPPQ